MKLTELKAKIDLYAETIQDYNDPEVVVEYKPPYDTVGGSPSVSVTGVMNGFDWDSGKFFIRTEKPLTLVNAEFEKKFKKLQDDYGWMRLENNDLKAEIKKLKAQLK